MDRRKRIKPGAKVGLKLTAAQRKLVLDDLMVLDESYAQAIRETPTDQPVQFSLDEWEDFGGYIAAEANHTEDKKLGNRTAGTSSCGALSRTVFEDKHGYEPW